MSSDFRRKFESETREVEKFFDDVLTMILPGIT